MLLIFLGVGAVALGLALPAAAAGGILGWIAAVLLGLVALVALGSLAFSVYGRYVGYWWRFTP